MTDDNTASRSANETAAIGDSDLASKHQLLFGGYAYDAKTSLEHARMRCFHPSEGKWISQEPAER